MYAACGSLFGFLNISTMTFRSLEKYIVIKKPFSVLKKDKRFTLSNLFSIYYIEPNNK